MFCSFYLILYIIWFQFSLSLSPFYYFDYYEHQYFTSVLFHMFSFIKNALFGSYSWMSHRTFIESSAVTTAFWLDQYGGRFASIFRRCPPSMFWGQCNAPIMIIGMVFTRIDLDRNLCARIYAHSISKMGAIQHYTTFLVQIISSKNKNKNKQKQ